MRSGMGAVVLLLNVATAWAVRVVKRRLGDDNKAADLAQRDSEEISAKDDQVHPAQAAQLLAEGANASARSGPWFGACMTEAAHHHEGAARREHFELGCGWAAMLTNMGVTSDYPCVLQCASATNADPGCCECSGRCGTCGCDYCAKFCKKWINFQGMELNGQFKIQQKSTNRFLDAHLSGGDLSAVMVDHPGYNNNWVIRSYGQGLHTIQQTASCRSLDAHVGCCDLSAVTRDHSASKNQMWFIQSQGGDQYTIQQESTMRHLDAHHHSGGSAVMRDGFEDPRRTWVITPVEGCHYYPWGGFSSGQLFDSRNRCSYRYATEQAAKNACSANRNCTTVYWQQNEVHLCPGKEWEIRHGTNYKGPNPGSWSRGWWKVCDWAGESSYPAALIQWLHTLPTVSYKSPHGITYATCPLSLQSMWTCEQYCATPQSKQACVDDFMRCKEHRDKCIFTLYSSAGTSTANCHECGNVCDQVIMKHWATASR